MLERKAQKISIHGCSAEVGLETRGAESIELLICRKI